MLTYHPPTSTPKCVLWFPIVHKSNKAIINNFLGLLTHSLGTCLENTKAVWKNRNSNGPLERSTIFQSMTKNLQ